MKNISNLQGTRMYGSEDLCLASQNKQDTNTFPTETKKLG